MEQVLRNLIDNAEKFTSNGGIQVFVESVSMSGYDEAVKFSVSDSGIGIAAGQQEKIFLAFNQQDTSTSRKFGGTGLGLSICSQIVELMEGKISVDSELGKGSTFSFIIPMPNSQEILSEVEEDLESCGQVMAMNILMVDDEIIIRELMKDFLDATPHNLITADNGKKGIELYKSEQFDLILMDLQMPGFDGYETTREIRRWEEAEKWNTIPIVAFSANVTSEQINKCLEAGCTAHLAKPVRRQQLIAAIEKHAQT